MFDVNAEAQLLQDTTLSFDHLVLGINVILIENEGGAPVSTHIQTKTELAIVEHKKLHL